MAALTEGLASSAQWLSLLFELGVNGLGLAVGGKGFRGAATLELPVLCRAAVYAWGRALMYCSRPSLSLSLSFFLSLSRFTSSPFFSSELFTPPFLRHLCSPP